MVWGFKLYGFGLSGPGSAFKRAGVGRVKLWLLLLLLHEAAKDVRWRVQESKEYKGSK